MESVSNPIEIVSVPLGRLSKNPWNPNRMEPDKRRKLLSEIKEKGFMAPLLVRPRQDGHQIVDGEHRYMIAVELGLSSVPCVVSEMDDREARLKTLQLNGLRGENDPDKLARLLKELAEDMDVREMAAGLPWTEVEIDQMLAMVTEEAGEKVKEARSAFHDDGLELFVAVVDAAQKSIIREALDRTATETGAENDGEALAVLCTRALAENAPSIVSKGGGKNGR